AVSCTRGHTSAGNTPSHSALPSLANEHTQTAVAAPTTQATITYRDACANEGSICASSDIAGTVPTALMRLLAFPALTAGQSCPASPGSQLQTDSFSGIALGTGPVRPIIASGSASDASRGIADLVTSTSEPPWLDFKTLWTSVPSYQGPIVIRAKRLDSPGTITMGEGPTLAALVVPPGPTLNSSSGWRTAPGGTWVTAPGCYGWQIDGLTFSYVITFQAVLGSPHYDTSTACEYGSKMR